MSRLATVLAGAMTEAWSYGGAKVSPAWRLEQAQMLVAAIPEAQREAMEAALDRCQWNDCGRPEKHEWHGDPDAHEHDPKWSCHPFQPLVPLGDPS